MEIYNPETNTVLWNELLNIPEFKKLSETPQNILWHKEGDAFKHTCMVTQWMLDCISVFDNLKYKDYDYREILVYSALFHDIGKIATTKKGEDGLYHCHNHAIKGVPIAEGILDKYIPHLNKFKKTAILSLIRYHMQPLYIMNQRNPEQSILKLVNNLDGIDLESLLLLKKCDCMGSITEKDDESIETLNKVRDLFYKVCSYPEGTIVQIEKVKDADTCDYKPNNHPHGINVGYIIRGILNHPVTKGFRTSLGFRFSTSPVTKIIDKNHFQTKNSVYNITEIK